MKKITLKLVICFVLGALVLPQQGYTQNMPHSQHVVYMEMFGQGGLFTFNYDRRFTKTPDGPGFRAGIGYVNLGKFEGYTIPVGLNYLLGKNDKYFELGLGLTYGKVALINAYDDEARLAATMFLGFRYQEEEGGFNFRAGLSPFLGNIRNPGEEPEVFFVPQYGGISVGYTFP